jgi:DNA processing protein
MTLVISPNTRAILLLTAPLIAGRGTSSPDLLSPGEYKRLARHLREMQRQPADLCSADAIDLLHECRSVIDLSRLQRLLGRGFLLSQAVERWHTRAIWVISRADAEYPRRLKHRLREDAPALLYGCGDLNLLESGGLAVVGSRHVDDSVIDYTVAVGRLAAQAGRTLVSGGAKGIDQAAMRGAIEAGGKVSGVLADSLEKTAMNREHRNLLLDGQLTLISPYDPSAGFNVGHAMQRNKLIYALADASLVVSSDFDKGGTWAGAIEQLEKLKLAPIYVRSTEPLSLGLDALRKKGALPWPDPADADTFDAVFDVVMPSLSASSQNSLALFPDDEPDTVAAKGLLTGAVDGSNGNTAVQAPRASTLVVRDSDAKPYVPTSSANADINPADTVFAAARAAIQRLLKAPMKDAEVAAALDISRAQAKAWLQRLVAEGTVKKQIRPVGYVAKRDDSLR